MNETQRLLKLYFAFSRGLYVIAAVALVTGLIAYLAGNLLAPGTIRSVGLPTWQELDDHLKVTLLAYGGFGLLGIAWLAQARIRALDATKRLAVAIVLFIVVPPAVYGVYALLVAAHQILVSHILLIIIFTALPPSFHWLFVRSQRKTLWEELQRNLKILRADDKQMEIVKWKFEALYGPSSQEHRAVATLTRETAFPVFFMTFVVGLG